MSPQRPTKPRLNIEKVAYWYFRLNGFLQIENFVVHPETGGSQRTDADLLAVRFPHRAERLFDHPFNAMQDDEQGLKLSSDLIDVIMVEVKTSQCNLNGPWTRCDDQNVHRVLAALGCIPKDQIHDAADDIYRDGFHVNTGLRVRLAAVGRDRSDALARDFPRVIQPIWTEMLTFIWERFNTYKRQKTQVDQWDEVGKNLKRMADTSKDARQFVEKALPRIW
jgi:hypothetical protein